MNVTFVNIDLSNEASIEHAIGLLRGYANLPPKVVQGLTALTFTLPTDEVATCASDDALGIYGRTTRAFLVQMLSRIDENGSTTLEEVANDMGITIDTARAYLRNAGRTASAYKVTLPVKPEWQPDMGCNTYTMSTG